MTATHELDRFFPLVMLEDDHGRAVEAPEVFTGRTNVVLVVPPGGGHQDAATWHPWLAERESRHSGFTSFEVHVDRRESPPAGVTVSPPVLHFNADCEQLMGAMGLTSNESVWVMTVSPDGLVHHVESGRFSPDAAARLTDALMSGA
jgi:hypothetical protein